MAWSEVARLFTDTNPQVHLPTSSPLMELLVARLNEESVVQVVTDRSTDSLRKSLRGKFGLTLTTAMRDCNKSQKWHTNRPILTCW